MVIVHTQYTVNIVGGILINSGAATELLRELVSAQTGG
jgi:hypothetical protein